MILVSLLCALQGGSCFFCGEAFSGPTARGRERRGDQWSRDHVLPLSRGGRLFILACVKCNDDKGCRLPTAEEMRRAVLLREQVDRMGRALQGAGWSTLKDEKKIVREKRAAAHQHHTFRWPRIEPSYSPFAL